MTPRFNANYEETTGESETRQTLPVLFHLIDVSRQRRIAPVAEPIAAIESPSETTTALAVASEPAAISAVPVEIVQPELPVQATSIQEPITLMAPSDVGSSETSQTAVVAKSEPEKEVTPAKSRRATELRRKPKIQHTEDWLTTHGKYVALGFVLALLATIYLARANRRPAPATAKAAPHAHPGDGGVALAAVNPSTAPKAGVTKQGPVASTATAASEVSPAKLAETSASNAEPKTELFPPAAPQLASKPSAVEAKSQTDERLFPWAKTGDAPASDKRLAARPPGPTMVVNPTLAAESSPPTSAAPGSAVTASPAATAPTANTGPPAASAQTPPGLAYPTTGDPPRSSSNVVAPPSTASAPAAPQQPVYPVTNYRSQYSPPAEMGGSPAGWSPAAPAGTMPPQYSPPDNSARGFRHDRTGSGLY